MEILGITEPVSIFRPQGCQFCNNSGYKGRVAIHEIMHMDETMKSMVTQTKSSESLRNLASNNGMINLWTSCRSLVLKGVTSLQELMTLNSD